MGLLQVGASPVHLAFRGTSVADSIRCDWRGIARTLEQRDAAVRYWMELSPDATLPSPNIVEIMLEAALDGIGASYIETAKSDFRTIARGGLSRDYLFLTCFADYTVSSYLLGDGPTTLTVAAYRKDGPAAVAHGNRGRRPHNAVPETAAAAVVKLASNGYAGANHSHFTDLLREREGIDLSRPTVRRILVRAGTGSPRSRRFQQHRFRRRRMPQKGMLAFQQATGPDRSVPR